MKNFINDYFLNLGESLESTLKTPDAYMNKIVLTVVVLAVAALLYWTVRALIRNRSKDMMKRVKLRKTAKQIILSLAGVSILFIWVTAINVLILLALLTGLIAVFMVRGLTTNIVAYFVIKSRKYFEIGQRVEVDGVLGDVMDTNLIYFKMLEARGNLSSDSHTGRVVKLPNSRIFDGTVQLIGGTNNFVWHELQYVLSFDSDWEAAESIITEAGRQEYTAVTMPAVERENHEELGETELLEPVFAVDSNDAGIVLTLRYLVDYRHGTAAKTRLQRSILPQLTVHPQIEFAVLEVKMLKG